MVVCLLLQIVFSVLVSLFDDGIGWELNGLDVEVLRLIDVWTILEDFTSINGDSRPTVFRDFVVAHDE